MTKLCSSGDFPQINIFASEGTSYCDIFINDVNVEFSLVIPEIVKSFGIEIETIQMPNPEWEGCNHTAVIYGKDTDENRARLRAVKAELIAKLELLTTW